MKIIAITLTICFLILLSPTTPAQTGQSNQSPELVESNALNSKVVKLYKEGKYDEALPFAKHALELREKALGPEHQDLVPILLNLGELYQAKEKFGDAQSYFDRALKLTEKALGPEDVRIARVLDSLAYVTFEQRDEKKAESLFTRSLAIKEKAFGPESPQLLQTALNLAHIYRFKGDYKKAEPLYQRVIRIFDKAGGKDTRLLSDALEAYAALLYVQKRMDEGLEIQKRLAGISTEPGVIEGGVLNGRALKLETPPYPSLARSDRASGVVYVQVLIDERGNVINAKAKNAGVVHPALVNAAENAARRSKFTPTLLSGVPVKVNGVIIYNFVAQ